MTGVNAIANLPPTVQGYYDKRAILRAKQTLTAYDLCDKRSLPAGNGTTVTFWRYAPLSKNTTALTEAVTDALNFGGITFAGRQQLVPQEVPFIPAEHGDYISVGKYANLVSIDQGHAEKLDVVTQQGAESIDYIINKAIAVGLQRRRADNDSTYQRNGTTTSAGSTTSVVASGLAGDVDDFWLGGFITITSGLAYGQTRQITAYTGSTGTFTTDAFDAIPGSGVTFRVVVGTGISASTAISANAVRRAIRDLKTNKAMKYDGQYFRSVLDPDTHFDFMDDSDFVKASIYKDNRNSLENLLVGTFAGCKFTETTQAYRETVAGVEADGSGAVHIVPILGKQAVSCVDLAFGDTKGANKNFATYVRNWDQLGQPIPRFSTIGWYALFEAQAMNGTFGIGLMCGATSN